MDAFKLGSEVRVRLAYEVTKPILNGDSDAQVQLAMLLLDLATGRRKRVGALRGPKKGGRRAQG